MTTYICDGEDSKGYEGYSTLDTFENDQAEFTSDDYDDVQVDDSDYSSYSTQLTDQVSYHHFDFLISENIEDISQIDITWIGVGYSINYAQTVPSPGYDVDFSLHVKENDSWTRKETGTEVTPEGPPGWSPSIQTLSTSKTSDFDEWVVSNHLHIGLQCDNSGWPDTFGGMPPQLIPGKASVIITDYIEVVITSSISPEVSEVRKLRIIPGIKLKVLSNSKLMRII